MTNTIDMMSKILEKNNIPLPYGTKKKDGGLNFENKERFHALVARYFDSSSFNIDYGSSRNIDYTQESFSYLHPHGQ